MDFHSVRSAQVTVDGLTLWAALERHFENLIYPTPTVDPFGDEVGVTVDGYLRKFLVTTVITTLVSHVLVIHLQDRTDNLLVEVDSATSSTTAHGLRARQFVWVTDSYEEEDVDVVIGTDPDGAYALIPRKCSAD